MEINNRQTWLITGGAGSIGSELVRQLTRNEDVGCIIALDANEYALFELSRELKKKMCDKELRFIPLSLTSENAKAILNLSINRKVDQVIHAAAFKHVPMSEENRLSYFNNNLQSTLQAIEIAQSQKAKFTLISTDKAVEPSNVMGETKRICEAIVLGHESSQFKIIRFGNVMNSHGSVMPIFREQIKNGGPVTVTDKDMKRYFMSISEAVSLITSAADVEYASRVLLLDMGAEIYIDTIARNLIEEAGFKPCEYGEKQSNSEIEIMYTGMRPGEKISEKLSYSETFKIPDTRLLTCAEVEKPSLEFIDYIHDCVRHNIYPETRKIDWFNLRIQ